MATFCFVSKRCFSRPRKSSIVVSVQASPTLWMLPTKLATAVQMLSAVGVDLQSSTHQTRKRLRGIQCILARIIDHERGSRGDRRGGADFLPRPRRASSPEPLLATHFAASLLFADGCGKAATQPACRTRAPVFKRAGAEPADDLVSHMFLFDVPGCQATLNSSTPRSMITVTRSSSDNFHDRAWYLSIFHPSSTVYS